MDKNIKHLVEHYTLPDQHGQYPLSKTDAEILDELLLAVAILPESQPLVEILNNWKKFKSCDEILADIIEYNELKKEDNAVNKVYEDYLSVGDYQFRVATLFSIKREDRFLDGRMSYNIIFNEAYGTKVPVNSNLEVCFAREEDREAELSRIKLVLRSYAFVRFL